VDANFAQPNFIVPTPPAGDSSNQAADTAFVQLTVGAIVTGVSTAYVTANTVANISTNFALTQVNSTGAVVLSSALTFTSNSLGADVSISTNSFTDGPSVAQGSTGTWFASGSVAMVNGNIVGTPFNFRAVLWDGATVIDSGFIQLSRGQTGILSLSGCMVGPAGNLRIGVECVGASQATMAFNASGQSKDCTITAIRIA
jgi:hypothetical protein